MAQVKFYADLSTNISAKAIENGAMYFATDTHQLFIDLNDSRVTIGTTWDEVDGKPSTFTPSSHTHSYAGSASAGGPATSAINDSKSQEIDVTYIKGVTLSGHTVTITKGDNTTSTFTIPDNNTTYSVATTSANGLMSSTDKSKLDGITASADSVSFTQGATSGTKVGDITINGSTTSLYAPTDTDTHYASKNVVGSSTATSNTTSALSNGNVYLNSVENGAVTSTHKISGSGATSVTSDTSGNIVISSTDNNTTYSTATTSAAGLMSAADKSKLDGVASRAQVNSITGIKGNAESSYRTGNVNITPANIGLGNVDNTADSSKSVASAATWTTARTLTLAGDVTGSASINGSANVSLTATVANDSHTHSNSTISSLDAGKITSGTIDIARLPAGALERLVTVADQTARFALTASDIQLGDTVKQTDTGIMYIVVDTANLANAAGYTEYTAASATSVPWSGVTGKPVTYPPDSHTHTKSQITDFPTSLPASDVYSWAKASIKPSYTKSEIGLENVDNTADASKCVSYATSSSFLTHGGVGSNWITGRDNAIIKQNSYSGYNPLFSAKTTNGSWECGPYANDYLYISYCSDTNHSAGTDSPSAQFIFKPNGYLSGNFEGSLSGNASTATALDTSAGSSTQPVYFSGGKPVAIGYTIKTSVPSGAIFTDHTYSLSSFGITSSATELNYCDGVTSNIQTQLDAKSSISHSHTYASLGTVPIANGGTGGTSTATAKANLSLFGTSKISSSEPTDVDVGGIWITLNSSTDIASIKIRTA